MCVPGSPKRPADPWGRMSWELRVDMAWAGQGSASLMMHLGRAVTDRIRRQSWTGWSDKPKVSPRKPSGREKRQLTM